MYTVEHFISKFAAIPSDQIGTDQYSGCAYGQCRSSKHAQDGSETAEGRALTKLMRSLPNLTPVAGAAWEPYISTPARINNGDVAEYPQPTPKQRILAALYDIKAQNEAVAAVSAIASATHERVSDKVLV